MRDFMKVFSCLFLSIFFAANLGADESSNVPEFMQSFVMPLDKPVSKEAVALNNLLTLNENMFTLYDKSLQIYRKNFLSEHPHIKAIEANDTAESAGNVSLGRSSRRMLRCSSALLSVANWRPP